MILTTQIQKALYRASELHAPHKRKLIERPYIVHPVSVAIILSEFTKDDEIIAAGLLHDVLEDAEGYSAEDMAKEFGERITNIVGGVTEVKHHPDDPTLKLTWEGRKMYYLDHLNKASTESLMVSCADKIHNLESLIEAYEKFGPAIWKSFHAAPERQRWFFEEVISIVRRKLHNGIVQRLEQTLVRATDTLQW